MKIIIAILALWAVNADAQSWLTRYESQIVDLEAKPKPDDGGIVVVGSSTIRMWSTITKDLSPLPVIQRGFGGGTTDEIKYYLDRIVLAYNPRAVVIYGGDNDLAEHKTPQYIQTRIKEIMTLIHKDIPDAHIYVIGVKPSPLRWSAWADAVATNKLLAALCADDERLKYIDAGKGLLGSDGKPKPEYFLEDQLHLTPAGYKVWTAAIRPVLLAGESGILPKAPTQISIGN